MISYRPTHTSMPDTYATGLRETLNRKGPDPGPDSVETTQRAAASNFQGTSYTTQSDSSSHALEHASCSIILLAGDMWQARACCTGCIATGQLSDGTHRILTESHKACSLLELDRRTSRCGTRRSPSELGYPTSWTVRQLLQEMSAGASLPRPSQLHLCQGGFLQRAILLLLFLTNEWVVMMIRERLRSRPATLPAWRSASLGHH